MATGHRGSDSVFSASFSGHPFSRPCESSLCSPSCRGHSRSFCRRRSPCSRSPKRGVPLLSSMCRASRNLPQYALLFVFVCWYIWICFLVPYFSPLLSISARDAFVDLSRVPRDTRTGHEWREPFTNERVL